jgi:DNA invertase Pin-like site-specific DNA recombinase
VSSVDQNLARQRDGIKLNGMFEDKASGNDTKRPDLVALQEFVREGDTVMVHSIDRLARILLSAIDCFRPER